ncbi:MAG TPA: hypothetical protein VGL19_05500 [Polyangiaceae bacterium]|jgi:hypothetical protein
MTSTKLIAMLMTSGALLAFSGVASAQTVRRETVTERGGPSRSMLLSGLSTFGISYGAAVVVAATSSLDADHSMYVPFAGPWMALSGRGPCGVGTPRTCNAATADKVLIITDGVFQALGGLLVVEAFFNPETRTVTRADARPAIRVVPQVGANGYGLAAFGNF